jgi:hypothetical protein
MVLGFAGLRDYLEGQPDQSQDARRGGNLRPGVGV